MSNFFAQTRVIARRDFKAVVATPTFLLFLLAPLFMIVMAVLGGTGASQAVSSAQDKTRIAAIVSAEDLPLVQATDAEMRHLYPVEIGPSRLDAVVSHGADDARAAKTMLAATSPDYTAVLYGPLATPTILRESAGGAAYLSELAEQSLRNRQAGLTPGVRLSRPVAKEAKTATGSAQGRQVTGYGAVFAIFFLTLLLAGQTVGMLAEEKSNKVIEILAAAAPLESVFVGKLVGMFGVALLFVSFWIMLGGVGLAVLTGAGGLPALTAAIGAPTFLILCVCYFAMAFMLLGAIFLGVGAQASTMREIQMMSLPITIFQVAMFGLASKAAGQPGSAVARFAEIFPFSSPFAMAARAANDAALWPHVAALLWQLLWVAITIWISARLFRRGVLKSGPGLFSFLRRRKG